MEGLEVVRPQWESIFSKELSMIRDSEIQRRVIEILTKEVSDRHTHEGASSTGKYHPVFSQGEGGLIRHVKAVVFMVNELCNTRPEMSKDQLIAAAILHDMRKYVGSDPYTKHEHPATMAALCFQYELPVVARLIESHMGIWNSNKHSKILLPIPCEEDEWLFHYADYIASRRWLKLDFDVEGNIVQ